MVYRILLSVGSLAMVFATVSANDQPKPPYRITLNRSYAVGMKTHEIITVTTSKTMKTGTMPAINDHQELKLECDIEVISLDGGHWSKITFTTTSLDVSVKATDMAFGAINIPLMAERKDGIVSFNRVDGKPLSVTDIQILKTCFVPAGEMTPDDLAGTDFPKSPGESWTINSDNLSKQLSLVSGGSMRCEPKNTSGTMKLNRVWEHKGRTYLQVGGIVTYDPVQLSGLSVQFIIEPISKASLMLSYQLPVDTTLPAAKMEEEFTLSIEGKQNVSGNIQPVILENTSKKTRWLTVLAPGTQPE